MPGSDTGAFEAAMWSLLGARGTDVLSFESFSEGWATDAVKQLKIDARVLSAPYGQLPDLEKIDFARDVVLCWNGTTSGVCLADGGFIPADREGLVLCDATSAAFAMELPFDKLDAVTWSWQKVLGGEARARHAGAVAARRRPPGELQARLAAAEDFPHDQGRQARWKASSKARRSTRRPCCAVEDYLDTLCMGREASAG